MIKKIYIVFLLFGFLISVQGQNWQSLETGLPIGGGPRVLYADSVDNFLYAAGSFDYAGTTHARGIARWNSIHWDSLGSGVDYPFFGSAPIYAMARYNNDLYVGGAFTYLGEVQARRLGKWNGSFWDTLSVQPFYFDPGITKTITCLMTINNKLYVGGVFDSIANQPCQSFTSWDGISWNPIGLPSVINYSFNPRVNSICEYNGEIYLAGNFASYLPASIDTIMDIIRWDGFNWRSVDNGMHGLNCVISKILVYQGELYIAGSFLKTDGNIGNNIQKWDGQQWSEVGGGTWGTIALDGQISDMIVHNNKLYVVGHFSIAGGISANNVAIWDGTNWCGLGSTFDNGNTSLCFYNDTLYVGGGYWTIDGDSIAHIAQWTAGNYVDQCGNDAGIKSESIDFDVHVYPNPAIDQIIISIPEEVESKNISYSIVNLLGEKLLAGIITQHNLTLDVSTLINGVYIIEITVGDKKVSKKLLKI